MEQKECNVRALNDSIQNVRRMVFTPDGKHIVVACSTGGVYVIRHGDGVVVRQILNTNDNTIEDIAMSRCGQYIAVSIYGHRIHVLAIFADRTMMSRRMVLDDKPYNTSAVALSPDMSRVFVVIYPDQLVILHTASGCPEYKNTFSPEIYEGRLYALSNTKWMLQCNNAFPSVNISGDASDRYAHSAHKGRGRLCAFSSAGTNMVMIDNQIVYPHGPEAGLPSDDTFVHLQRAEPTDGIHSLTVDDRRGRAFGRTTRNKLHIWSATTGSLLSTLTLSLDFYRIEASPDGCHVLFANSDGGCVQILSTQRGAQQAEEDLVGDALAVMLEKGGGGIGVTVLHIVHECARLLTQRALDEFLILHV